MSRHAPLFHVMGPLTGGGFLQAAAARTEATSSKRDTARGPVVSSAGRAVATVSDGAALTPAGVLSLQRTAGNKAVSRLLSARGGSVRGGSVRGGSVRGGPARTPGSGRPGPLPVQRFPATALSAPVNWADTTGSVFRPGEGVSGGVYILTSKEKDPAIKKVVVKPVYGKTGLGLKETGEQLQFGDKALSQLLGVSTPTSKVVNQGTPEFSSLMSQVLPHKPPKPPPSPEGMAETAWQDLADARQFVVMSEVPSARSVGSFADKAMTDNDSRTDFFKTLFDPGFVAELARISVGDLLIGNIDRFVMATNLGNLMISSEGGESKYFAIDTTPYLDRNTPEQMATKAGNMNRNLSNTKKVSDDPAQTLHDFFNTVLTRMKEAATAHEKAGNQPVTSSEPPWKLFEDTYLQQKAKLERVFLLSWRSTMSEVHFLVETKEGRQKMKDLTGEFKGTAGDDQLTYETLKARAMYLSGRARLKGHDESALEPSVYLAYKQLQQLSASDFVPNDRFNPRAAGTLGAGAASANLPSVPALSAPKDAIEKVVTGKGVAYDPHHLDKTGAEVDSAKSQLARLGTKRERKFGFPVGPTVERNRVQAGEFIANSYLVGMGEARLPAFLKRLSDRIDLFGFVEKGNLGPAKTSSLLPLAKSLSALRRAIEGSAAEYSSVIPGIAQSVRGIRRYRQRAELADTLERVDAFVKRKMADFGAEIDKKDPDAIAASLVKMPPLPQAPGGMPPLPPIPSGGGTGQ